MARKMKTSGKFVLTIVGIVALVVLLKVTGLWEKLAPGKKAQESSIPQIDGISPQGLGGTSVIRLAHWTWNSHQAWALANKGKTTQKDSIFARNKISLQFKRMEEIPLQIAALKAFASGFDRGAENPADGVHFFTIMGDAGSFVLADTNKALRDVNSRFEAEIIGFSGFSAGEDKFMGPPAWKKDPQAARGGVVAGVPADGDWNIMIFWCAQNQVPFNPDAATYDPGAVNFVETDSYVQAGEIYITGKPVERKFTADGKDYQGKPVRKGDKGLVAINGAVTWTPVDKNIADKKGGLVSIVSTREYSNQMPQFIIGLKQWNNKNREKVENMLASIFEASNLIIDAGKKLKAGEISEKSSEDYRWLASKYAHEIFESETPEYWYKYFDVVKTKDKEGLIVDVGGSSVSNLQRNVDFFGLAGGADIGKVVYERFGQLAQHYYPDRIKKIEPWNKVFDAQYIKGAAKRFPQLAKTAAELPSFSGSEKGQQIGELTYRIPFEGGSARIRKDGYKILQQALGELVIVANSRIEIHGHTASTCPQERCLTVAKDRSEAVKDWLKEKAGSSFPEGRVSVIPHGKSELFTTDYIDGRFVEEKMALNRRVVLKIYAN